MAISAKPHEDNNAIRIDYDESKATKFFNKSSYRQIKSLFGISATAYHELLHILDNNTLTHIKKINKKQWKIACMKRKHVRAILLLSNWKFWTSKDSLVIWTNSIEKKAANEWWSTCPRIVQQLDSTSDKLLCSLSCWHIGCAEKNLIHTAHALDIDLFWSKIVLFGHTEWPCATCCDTLAEKWIKAVIVWSPPVDKFHKDYDPDYARTGYKVFITPEHLLRRMR